MTEAVPQPAAPAAVSAKARQLRVALVWNETIQQEELYSEPVSIGLGGEWDFPIPEGVTETDQLLVLEPDARNGYVLRLDPAMGGAVWVSGNRHSLDALGVPGTAVPIGPNDYGVITAGSVALFFQFVPPAPKAPRRMMGIDPAFIASWLLMLFLTLVMGIVVFDQMARQPSRQLVGLQALDERAMDFVVTQPDLPPPSPSAEESGTDTPDPGLRGREEGGRASDGAEGRVGERDSQTPDTHVQGPPSDSVSQRVRDAPLLQALNGPSGNPIASALNVPTVGDILGGMGDAPTRVGRGSAGAGLRGSGGGGGGMGPGSLYGAGNVGTGSAVGTGGGTGMGAGGIGAAGRERSEVRISVRAGRPRVSNGYLSPAQIQRVVNRRRSAIRVCYETALQRSPNLRGRVSVSFRIGLSGSVSGARVASSSIGNGRVEGCVVRVVRGMRFPQPDGGEVRVTYPFIMGAN